jgi:hypothetical protein
MSDLICRSQEALTVDLSLPKWQRLESMLEVFSGLQLSDLDDDVRDEFEEGIARVNQVLSRYELEASDDYQSLSEADLDEALAAVTGAATRAIDNELSRIVLDLDGESGKLPVAAIEEARQHRELIIPHLVDVIREAYARVQRDCLEGNAHFLAFFLLSEFHSEEGFDMILDAMSLPGEWPFDLFGDVVTETFARVLAQFAGDRPELLDDMIADRNLNEYVRGEAARTYIYLVRDERMQRDEAVQRLRKQLRHALDRSDVEIITPLVTELARFGAHEALEEIREAFETGLVETFMVDFGTAENMIADSESTFRRSIERCRPTGIKDTIAELRTWASYSEEANKPHRAPPRSPKSVPGLAPVMASNVTATNRGRVGRNEPCPCGSGKKFKKCCMH